MTVRTLVRLLPVLMLVVPASSVSGQMPEAIQWSIHRPDGHAPISISNDHILEPLQLELGVKFLNYRFEGQGVGSDSIPVDEVLTLFNVAPTVMTTRGAEVNLLVGITRHLTLSASGTFLQKKADYLGPIEGEPDLFLYYQQESLGPGDVKVAALYNIFDRGAVRIHAQAGVSIPIGAIDESDEVPGSTGEFRLPYMQQLGSGTFDVLPGVTASIQNEVASLGVQWNAAIRIGENDGEWAYGDLYQATLWAGYMASDWVSASLGVKYSRWGNVEGFDPNLDPFENPANNTLGQAGTRVEIPVGLNFIMPQGRFGGHRFGLEFLLPVHQDLDGPQIRHDWSIVAGWQKAIF